MSTARKLKAAAVLAWMAAVVGVALIFIVATAHGAPASQPASVPLDPSNPTSLFAGLFQALLSRNWPVLVMGVIVAACVYERHWVGLTGPRVSAWLGSRWGLLITTAVTAIVTAGAGVAVQGWKAVGHACLDAAGLAALNFVFQIFNINTPASPAPMNGGTPPMFPAGK